LLRNIAVVGAGIGGLCSALALVKQGFKVTVHEQAAALSEVGAGLQLSPNAMQVLKQLGLAAPLSPYVFRPQNAVMRHYKSGKNYFSVPLGGNCLQQFGAEYWHVHRADLHHVLYQACMQNQVNLKLNSPISTYVHGENSHSVDVVLNDAEKIQYDLVIGADGIHSKIQTTLSHNLGLSSKPRFTGQVAWRGTVKTKDLPPNLVEPNANLWVGPGKHFVSYYLRGGEEVNFVAVEERTNWQQESWSQEGDIAKLRGLFVGWHPHVQEILAATHKTFLWALHDREPLTSWVDKNVTLLGDACHPMLPFLAQGAAMAIEDAYVLAALLKTQQDTPTALQQYQRLRLGRTRSIQLNARQNASLYHMSSALERAKLKVLAALSGSGISSFLARKKLQHIYGHNVVKNMESLATSTSHSVKV
jgi:salicylate hydroxylase